MRTVDIITSQKVTIRYELAELRDRIAAWLIDFVIIIAAVFLLFAFLEPNVNPDVLWPRYLIFTIPFFYHLFFESRFQGQSPGKKAMGLRVVKLDGRRVTMTDYLIRWMFRLVDITLSAGTIAVILISSGHLGQRLGDILSNAAVIKLNPTHSVYLPDLMKIQTNEGYKPQYPGVRSFTEREMLLLKETMDRVRKYPNGHHQDALSTLGQKVASRLGLAAAPADTAEFLKAVLKDYVVMTR